MSPIPSPGVVAAGHPQTAAAAAEILQAGGNAFDAVVAAPLAACVAETGEADLNPHGFHRWPCDTRMTSMMAPTLARLPGQTVVLGSGGSNRLRTAILQVLSTGSISPCR